MLLSYVYKLRPSKEQAVKLNDWINILRSHYNWCLSDRIATYYQQFIQGDYCDICSKGEASPLTCCVVKNGATGNPWKGNGKKRSAAAIQDAGLVDLKQARPWFKSIDSDILQRNVARLDTAYKNFFKEGRGFPRFRNRSNFRSFEYKPRRVKLKGSKLYLPGIGWCRFFNSRPIPIGFKLRTVTIRKKADGFYVSIRIEDKSVPDYPLQSLDEVVDVIGIDLGLTKLVHFSDGTDIDNPRPGTSKRVRRRLRIRQRRVNRKKKGSKRKSVAQDRVNRLLTQVAHRRSGHQWRIANLVVAKGDCIVMEDLGVSNMMRRCKAKTDNKGRFLPNGQSAKRGLNRSIADASWGDLTSKIEYTAAKSGKIVLKVNPKHTSMTCSKCGHVDKASRNKEKFICTNCGHIAHADKQAAINIRNRGIEQYEIF